METNIYTIVIKETEYKVRIIPFLKSEKSWSFIIEDLPPTTRFSIELKDNESWIQIDGQEKIDDAVIQEVGNFIRKQYL